MKLDITKREREIITLLNNGRTQLQAAGELGLSKYTVNSLVRRARLRNQLGSTNALMAAVAGRLR